MSAPNLTVTVEPFESGKVVYLPLAPKTNSHDPRLRLLLQLTITNNGGRKVTMKDLTISFIGTPVLLKVTRHIRFLVDEAWVDMEIGAHQTAKWWFQRPEDDVILPVPAPEEIKLRISCHGFDDSFTVTLPLAAHQSPTPFGSYLFPARANDLETNEFWSTEGDTHGIGVEGSQSFGYDMGVVGFDPPVGWSDWKVSASGNANEDYRIWNKPILAMADGIVRHHLNDVPDNPHPLKWETQEELDEKLREQRDEYWGAFARGGAGNHFYLQHGDEIMLYAHMKQGTLEPRFLHVGAEVKAGEQLGLAGNSGNSSSPHLHIHAIQGTDPEVGPLRPILFRDVRVLERAAFTPPSQEGAWAGMNGQGIPAVLSLIWPTMMPPSGIDPGKWLAVVYILFGVTNDGGGLAFTPGGDPVPIDPLRVLRLAPEKRDILLGLALTELASLASRPESRREMGRVGVEAMTKALDRLSKQV